MKVADATPTPCIDFSKIQSIIEPPDLLKVQLDSFHNFIQDSVPLAKRRDQGLEKVLRSAFPITDTRGLYLLEYISYSFDRPKYTVEECIERGLTYDVSLKIKLKLSYKDEADEADWKETIQQEVYLGRIPYMTERGTFIVNGAERVVVAQLHRSPGVVFSEAIHPNGKKMYSAKIVPTRGSWIEFQTDINNQIYVYIDQKKNFLVTALLRAIGFAKDEDILGLFDMVEEVEISSKGSKREQLIGQYLASDIIDMQTGEVVSARSAITEEIMEQIVAADYKKIKVMKTTAPDKGIDKSIIINTILNDSSATEEQALEIVYEELRANEAPDIDAARSFLERTFFNQKKYDLGDVGRYRIQKKLRNEISELDAYLPGKPELKELSDAIYERILQTIRTYSEEPIGDDILVLTHYDIIAVINYLIKLVNGMAEVDDVDHLANRRVRSVGEQLAAQFVIGLARMGKNVREKLNSRDSDKIAPADLINARTVSSVVSSFFATSQLSQFMDQTNPLAEMTNKRRVSALGPGGLTRERAGFEVRDVHYTHYGRLCPIETPEGPNIGLISSLSVYAEINDKGFIQTPYRLVENGQVTDKVVMLSAEDEENKITVPVSIPLDANNKIAVESVQARTKGDYPLVPAEDVNYMDVSPVQIVSAAAALIPFLEHDDGNRALMGANMQRQAVPLLISDAPVVGTGMEAMVARDSRAVILAEGPGVVQCVTAERIEVRYDLDPENNTVSLLDPDEGVKVYKLIKFKRSNQDTCISQRPLVRNGQRVDKGDVLADSSSTDNGELALGKNVLVAFMPWRGYNFEDAIVLSERLVYDDVFTSIHVHEFESNVRDTKRGEEQFTRDIYNVSEEALRNLDENGIVRIGAEVKERDILVGKITPKGESDPTPEEKLLRAIFGDKSSDVKDASMHVPAGMKGIVIKTKLFSRKKKVGMDVKEKLEAVDKQFDLKEADLRRRFARWMKQHLDGKKSVTIMSDKGKVLVPEGTIVDDALLAKFNGLPFLESIDVTKGIVSGAKTNENVVRLIREYRLKLKDLSDERDNEKYKINVGDELPPGIEELAKVYIAQKRKIQVGDKMAGRHGNKGVVGKILPIEDMPFMADGTPVDIVLNPLGVPSRMNIGQLYETSLGWAGKKLGVKFKTPIFNGATYTEVQQQLEKAGLPGHGKVSLFDGRTGEQFHDEVTVGYIYMLKLSHLVDDKIHARSIGPYSLITQQPLGGKAQFGGQRFGEMEVWALEAYGAANILREMLTVKSDDVIGRNKTYEAIVKGQNLPEPGTPESFNVLVRELQGLGLEIRIDDRVP